MAAVTRQKHVWWLGIHPMLSVTAIRTVFGNNGRSEHERAGRGPEDIPASVQNRSQCVRVPVAAAVKVTSTETVAPAAP
jgi:hypothetical protein